MTSPAAKWPLKGGQVLSWEVSPVYKGTLSKSVFKA